MSRHILGEYVLTGTLIADSALAIGSGLPGASTDMACVRDGAGTLVIPGTALAGVLSASFVGSPQWGNQELASHLYVEDSAATDDAATEVRDGVGIDRNTGSAAEGVLYSRDVVPAGTRFALELRVEAAEKSSEKSAVPELTQADARTWITRIRDVLATGESVGASTTTGLGLIRLESYSLQWRGIGTRKGLLSLLKGEVEIEESKDRVALKRPDDPLPNHLRITIPWQPRSPLLVSVSANGLVDRLPLTTGSGQQVRLVIPGSSLKGVLRTRAERIVRTLTDAPLPEGNHLEQLAQALGPVQRIFGRPPQKGRSGERSEPGRRGAIEVRETYSPTIKEWDAVLGALATRAPRGDDPVANAKPRIDAIRKLRDSGPIRINDHVAISRWTGGAAEDRLFAIAAPGAWFGGWDPMVLDVDLQRLGGRTDERLSALMLLAYLVRDLAEGWIGIGYGTTRGYGEVGGTPDTIAWAFADSLPAGLERFEGKGRGDRSLTLSDLFSSDGDGHALAEMLLDAWSAEVEQLNAGSRVAS